MSSHLLVVVKNKSNTPSKTTTINVGDFDATNKTLQIDLNGEQTTYPEGTLSELYIPLDLEVKTSRLAATEKSTLKMMYINLIIY